MNTYMYIHIHTLVHTLTHFQDVLDSGIMNKKIVGGQADDKL